MTSARRGRPRSESTRVAILTATRDLVIERGYDGLTVSGIAERAGAGVQTIYRWWPDKAAIVADCVLGNLVDVELITARDSGDATADLRSWLQESYEGLSEPTSAALFRALAVAASKDSAVAERLDQQLGARLRSSLQELIARGVDSGQFRSDISSDAAADVMVGAMLNSIITRRAHSPTQADVIADLILGGLRRHTG